MKKALFLCIASLFSGVALAHNADEMDIVCLKDGSVVRGTVIEQGADESLKSKTEEGHVFVYQADEIDKMKHETERKTRSLWDGPRGLEALQAKPNGYGGALEAGYGIGVGGYGSRFELDVVNGYRFNPRFYLGLGVGVNVWTNGSGMVTLPVFAHFRANLWDRPLTPFFALSAGYNYVVAGDPDGGLMVEPTVGVALRTSNRTTVTFGVGYSGQQYSAGYDFDSNSYVVTGWASAVRIKIGFTF